MLAALKKQVSELAVELEKIKILVELDKIKKLKSDSTDLPSESTALGGSGKVWLELAAQGISTSLKQLVLDLRREKPFGTEFLRTIFSIFSKAEDSSVLDNWWSNYSLLVTLTRLLEKAETVNRMAKDKFTLIGSHELQEIGDFLETFANELNQKKVQPSQLIIERLRSVALYYNTLASPSHLKSIGSF